MSNYQHERGWLDSEVWGEAAYDERSAWSWMIGEAGFASSVKSVSGIPVKLDRGQFTSSLRFMADKWKWSGKGAKDKVRRFLDKLERWEMISSATDRATGQTVITICNYDKYQAKRGSNTTESATPPRHHRDRGATATRQTINPSSPSSPNTHTTGLDELSVFHVEDWLSEKRAIGRYLTIDEHALLEMFKNYCQSKGQKYKDYVAAYRNSFNWNNAPKIGGTNAKPNRKQQVADDTARILESIRAGGNP